MAENIKETKTKPEKTEKEPEIVSIPSEKLREILDTIEKLQESNKKLIAVADLNRLDRYEQMEKNKNKIVHTARLRFFEGKPIVAWLLTKDEVFKDTNGVYHETQMVKLFFNDGTEKEMSYIDSERFVTKKEGEIISRKQDQSGNETVELRFNDGEVIVVDTRYIN